MVLKQEEVLLIFWSPCGPGLCHISHGSPQGPGCAHAVSLTQLRTRAWASVGEGGHSLLKDVTFNNTIMVVLLNTNRAPGSVECDTEVRWSTLGRLQEPIIKHTLSLPHPTPPPTGTQWLASCLAWQVGLHSGVAPLLPSTVWPLASLWHAWCV